jgi:hypothetical protein
MKCVTWSKKLPRVSREKTLNVRIVPISMMVIAFEWDLNLPEKDKLSRKFSELTTIAFEKTVSTAERQQLYSE